MKFIKRKKYSILLDIIKYSFVGIFAIALILPTLFVSDFTKKANATTTNPTLTISNITQTTAFFTASGLEQPTSANPYRYSIIIADESYEQIQSYELGDISPAGVGTETATDLDWGVSYFAYIKDNTINTGGLITYQMFPFTTLGTVPIHQESVTSTNIESNSVNLSLAGLETQNVYYVVLIRLFSSSQYIGNKIISGNDINAGVALTQFTNLLPNTQYTIDLDKYTTLPGGGNITPPALLNPAYNFTTLTSVPNSPTITNFSPASGVVGDLVVINGQNFDYANEIIFGTTSTSLFTMTGSTKIMVNVPSGATTGKITVKSVVPPGTIVNTISTSDFTVTSNTTSPSMTVSNITDTRAQLNGQNFPQGNYKIYFVRSDGATPNYINSTQLEINGNFTQQVTALLPCVSYTITARKDSVTGNILASTDFVTKDENGQACSANSPKITSITPTSGKVGDTITIKGQNLISVNKVIFNETETVTNTSTPPTEITVLIPTGATSGKIKIITANGSVTSLNSFTVSGTGGEVNPPGPVVTEQESAYEYNGVQFKGLVPICNKGAIDPVTGNYANPCNFNMVMALINRFINFLLITLATPLFALIIIYVGWLYLSDMGSTENIKKAKTIFKNVFIGYIIALAAWLIVKTILVSVGFDPRAAYLSF